VDLSVGNEGDWICADLATPWTPPQTGTPYNILSSEDNNGDMWYCDNTQATSDITWSTYADPACTTSAGNADNGGGGFNYLYGPGEHDHSKLMRRLILGIVIGLLIACASVVTARVMMVQVVTCTPDSTFACIAMPGTSSGLAIIRTKAVPGNPVLDLRT
jgi:hypothetical protein